MSDPKLVALWDAVDKWARARYRPGEKNISRAEKAVVEVQDCARAWANADDRAAHEETRRRLAAVAMKADAWWEAMLLEAHDHALDMESWVRATAEMHSRELTGYRERESALEQSRRELAEMRKGAFIAGEVVKKAKADREAAESLVNKLREMHTRLELTPGHYYVGMDGCRRCKTCLTTWPCPTAQALAPSRHASEPAEGSR